MAQSRKVETLPLYARFFWRVTAQPRLRDPRSRHGSFHCNFLMQCDAPDDVSRQIDRQFRILCFNDLAVQVATHLKYGSQVYVLAHDFGQHLSISQMECPNCEKEFDYHKPYYYFYAIDVQTILPLSDVRNQIPERKLQEYLKAQELEQQARVQGVILNEEEDWSNE